MPHVPIDSVLYRLSETGARPSIDLAQRIPGSSRVDRKLAKSGRNKTVKGLAFSAVVKERISANEYRIVVKGTRAVIGRVIKQGKGRTSGYGYHLKGDVKTHNGFASQKEAIMRMLTKV